MRKIIKLKPEFKGLCISRNILAIGGTITFDTLKVPTEFHPNFYNAGFEDMFEVEIIQEQVPKIGISKPPRASINIPHKPGHEHIGVYGRNRIDYKLLKTAIYTIIKTSNPVDVAVIIPVKGRTHFTKTTLQHFKRAMEHYSKWSYSITIVEYSDKREHENICGQFEDVNYIHLPFDDMFNKCLSMNVGALYNKANAYLFHDLDILVQKDFFEKLSIDRQQDKSGIAIQPFKDRRVLYCNDGLTKELLKGMLTCDMIDPTHRNVMVPPKQYHKAPGGSIFCSSESFKTVGGYDAELFTGYSCEDQFFYDKLKETCGIKSLNTVEVYHMHHESMSGTNPEGTKQGLIAKNYFNLTPQDKQKFMLMESMWLFGDI